jgi:hypothetical protein
VRVTIGRHLFFVVLAAIGAFYVAYGVAEGIAFDLWTGGQLVFSGPPRLEPTLAAGSAAGAFVAWRLAGWRGLLGLVAFAALGLLGPLRYFIPAVRCVAGDRQQCAYWGDLFGFSIAQLWLVVGLVVGVVAALVARPRIPFRTALEAAGVLGLAGPVRFAAEVLPLYLGPPVVPNGELQLLGVADLAIVLAAGVVAGLVVRRRASDTRLTGLALAVVVVLLTLPAMRYQLRFPASGLEEVVRLGGFLVALVIAAIAVPRPRRAVPLVA